jgi:hypothetical protein
MKKAVSVLLAIAMVLTVIQAGIFTASANIPVWGLMSTRFPVRVAANA